MSQSFSSEIERLFAVTSLYDLFGVNKGCSASKLKKAFYKHSLKYHPDRQKETPKEIATEQFQILSKAYSILSDDDKRAVYDETGAVDDEDVLSSRNYGDWIDYWSLIFPRVTTESIQKFKETYVGSKEELDDIAKLYERFAGDIDHILEHLMFGSADSEDRLRAIIDQLIIEDRVESFDAYVNEPKSKTAKRARRHKAETNAWKTEQKVAKQKRHESSDLDSLALAIAAKQSKRMLESDKLLAHLTEKYCSKPVPKKVASAKRQSLKRK